MKILNLAVIVSALGYFVDIFDLSLFSVIRVQSLQDLGYQGPQLMEVGVRLLNSQMLGLLLGGVFWGVLGDRIGRVSILFLSIFLYSASNFANAFVNSADSYSVLRFIAGFGLAGELGLGITLVSEILPAKKRGYGTTLVAAFGLCGSIGAALVAEVFHWRTAFMIGGGLGFLLLILRFRIHDSGLFKSMKKSTPRGQFLMLFATRERFLKYISIILIGVPIWVTVGIGMTFAPELAKALGVVGEVTAGRAIFYTYIGVAIGDVLSGLWSQKLKSRKKVLAVFIAMLGAGLAVHLSSRGVSNTHFYWVAGFLGVATGYWAVFITTAAELFGTNLRSTATTSIPNFVRGAVVPATLLFRWLSPQLGFVWALAFISTISIAVAYWALWNLEESFGKDLTFVEK